MTSWLQRLCCDSSPTKPQASNTPIKERRRASCIGQISETKRLITFQNHQIYQGEISDKKRSGYGVHTYNNKDQYEGEWLDDKRHGRGKMLYHNGDFFMGEWVEDRKQGRGLYVYHDMTRYEGEFKNDMKEGNGKLTQVNGCYYEGEFSKDEKDGKGIVYNPENKRKYKNTYKAGVLLLSEIITTESKQDSKENIPRRSVSLSKSVLQERPKVTEQDLHFYEQHNPQVKDIDMEQLLSFQCLLKVKSLSFLSINPKMWKGNYVSEWLKAIGLQKYQAVFLKNKITGNSLLTLTEVDLKEELGMKIGDIKIFMRSVKVLKSFGQRQKKQKRTLKHLKSYKSSERSNYKSLGKMLYDLKNNLIVEENAENQSGDSEIDRSEKKIQEKADTDSLNFNTQDVYHTGQFKTSEFQQYESLNSLNIVEERKAFKYNKKEQECIIERDIQEKESLEDLPSPTIKKEQSRKPSKPQEDLEKEVFEENRKNEHSSESSSSSTSSQESEEKPARPGRKKSRGDQRRHMEMRELYQYLKDHHISMMFLIPQNQILNPEEIGEGGYGKVYKAKWMSHPVAVKTYLKAGRIHRKSLEDFLKEVEILSNLRHPNVVLYMGMCIQINRYSMVTEYMPQGSLFDHIHRKHTNFSIQKIYEMVEDMVLGMVYLHAKNILHRDLKSSNVLIGEDWKVKLCDFGLSEIHSKKTLKGVCKARIGTYQWMAPQVLQKKNYGFSSDVYSFGVILWELLNEEIPHKDKSHNQIIGVVGYDEDYKVPTPKKNDPFLTELMYSCLEKDPEKRPSFLEIVDMLKSKQAYYKKNTLN